MQYADMLCFSMMGFLVSGAFLGRAYFDYLFTIVGCCAILRRTAFDRWQEIDAAEEDEQNLHLEGGALSPLEGAHS